MPLTAVCRHAFEDRLPRGASEEVVVDDEERADSMPVTGVTDPAHHRFGVAGAHRAAHDVLHAAVRARKRAASRRVDGGHGGGGEAVKIRVADRRELRVGDDWHGDLAGARLGADPVGDAVGPTQPAGDVIVEQLAPDGLRLADDGRDAAVLEKSPCLGIAAHVKTADEHRKPRPAEPQREIAAARVLIGLHAGEPDDDLHAVLEGFLLDGADRVRQDRPVHLLVPEHGLEVDALLAVQLVVCVVERRQDREGVVRQHALPEPLDPAGVVVLRRLDEIDTKRSTHDRLRARLYRRGHGVGHDAEVMRARGSPPKEDADEEHHGAAEYGGDQEHGRPPCVSRTGGSCSEPLRTVSMPVRYRTRHAVPRRTRKCA